jgi:UDP-galactopyranose mutase
VSVRDLLEEAEEGAQVTLEVNNDEEDEIEVYEAELKEIYKEYTKEQRKQIQQHLDDRNLSKPSGRYLEDINPDGTVIKGVLSNEEEGYTIEINPMSTAIHVTLRQDEEQTDLSVNSYIAYEKEVNEEKKVITSELN